MTVLATTDGGVSAEPLPVLAVLVVTAVLLGLMFVLARTTKL